MTEYKDTFTLDGRLNPQSMPRVTKAKVAAIRELFNAGIRGDRIAASKFSESIATSDAVFNAAYLINIQVLPQFDLLPRTWTQIAGTRELPDFRPAVLTGIFGGFEGLKRDGTAAGNGQVNPAGIAPVVAEAETYPYATIGQVEASYGRLKKRGFKVGYTWEARINDGIDFFSTLPQEMLNVALDTEEWEVYQALLSTQASRQLTGGTIYDGGAALNANSAIGRRAVLKAVQDLSQRTVNGRFIQVSGGYNLIVPIGATPAVEFALQQPFISSVPAAAARGFVRDVNDPGQNIIGSITIVESQYVTGTNWYLLPKPGAVRRPVLELGRLRGNAAPELRVDAQAGNYVGGGQVSPFEGNFANDTIDLRLRYPLTGILWDDRFVVWSTGAGAYVAE
jgi:hypothetical protein